MTDPRIADSRLTQPPSLHLAQFNIARLRHPVDHPDSAGFVALIDETNARAEASPGFAWRHGIDARDASDAPYDDPLITVNASVWQSVAHLRDFAYRGFHREVYRRRQEWMTDSAAVMWWLPAGSVPSMQACMARLAFHDQHGTTPYAFETGQNMSVLAVVPDGDLGLRLWVHDRWAGHAKWLLDGDVATLVDVQIGDERVDGAVDVTVDVTSSHLRAALIDAVEVALRDLAVRRLVTDNGEVRDLTQIRHRGVPH